MCDFRQLIAIPCVVGMLLSATAQAIAAERYGGVEIGAKGIKAAAVEVDSSGSAPTLKVLELDKKTVEVTISQLKEKNFKDELIADVAAVVEKFMQALSQKLQVPEANIRIVASSGMPFANNIADLVSAVREKTGKEVGLIDATEEALLTTIALVPKDQWTRTIVIDIGSGNTKGGEFLDASGKREAFAAYNVPFGVVTLGKAIDDKATATGNGKGEVGLEVSREMVGKPLQKAFEKNTSKSKEAKKALLAGGAVWAMVTILKPETALDPFPQVTAGEIKSYLALITKTGGQYPEVDFARVTDPKAREAAEADYNRIRGDGGKTPVFKPEDLLSGAFVLNQVSDALGFATRSVYFDRKAVTAWITAKITPPAYWPLLPKALGREVPQSKVTPRAAAITPGRGTISVPAVPQKGNSAKPEPNNTAQSISPSTKDSRPSSSPASPSISAPANIRSQLATNCDSCGCYDPCSGFFSRCCPTNLWLNRCNGYSATSVCVISSAPTITVRSKNSRPLAAAPVRSTLDPAAIAELAAEKLKGTTARKVRPKEAFAAYKTAEMVPVPNAAAAQVYYGQGSHQFWSGDYSAALEQFRSAVAADDHDARFWYFKGFSEQRLGLNQQALDSLATGAKLEIQGYPGRAILYRSLERVQGAERLALKEAVLKAQLVRQSSPPPAHPASRVAQSSP